MTHKEKWLEVGEAFLTPRSKRTKSQRGLACDGLCYAIYNLRKMKNCKDYLNFKNFYQATERMAWWFGLYSKRSDQIRGLMALLISNIPEDEYLELCREEN